MIRSRSRSGRRHSGAKMAVLGIGAFGCLFLASHMWIITALAVVVSVVGGAVLVRHHLARHRPAHSARVRERDQLADDLGQAHALIGQLRGELHHARASAQAAWDAAADRPPVPRPRPRPEGDQRDELLDDPRSGAHPLGGGQ